METQIPNTGILYFTKAFPLGIFFQKYDIISIDVETISRHEFAVVLKFCCCATKNILHRLINCYFVLNWKD